MKRYCFFAVAVLLLVSGPSALLSDTFVSGTIANDTTWTAANSPYIVTSTVSITTNTTLLIEPGVEVQLYSTASLCVYGGIRAEGATNNSITFTKFPAHPNGRDIQLLGTGFSRVSTGVFSYCTFSELSGPTLPMHEAVHAEFCELTISDCTFTNMPEAVIRPLNSRVTIVGNVIYDTREAINAIQCAGRIASNRISKINGYADGIDLDFVWAGPGDGTMVIEGNTLANGLDIDADAIDLGTAVAIVRGNVITNFGDKGLSIGEGSSGEFYNNLIMGCTEGISIKDLSTPLLSHNTIVDCSYGIRSKPKSTLNGGRGSLTNSIIWGCAINISLEGDSTLSVGYSAIEGASVWPGVGNITNNPLFADAVNSDYRLLKGSPCIDAGTNLVGITNDLDRMLRPMDGDTNGIPVADMGAYEYLPIFTCGFTADPTDGIVPLAVIFTATVFGTNTTELFYLWDFENDGTPNLTGPDLAVVTNVYSVAAHYSVSLVVSNAVGDRSSVVRGAYVRAIGPPSVENTGAANVAASAADLCGVLMAGGDANAYIFFGTNDGGTVAQDWQTNVYAGVVSNVPFSAYAYPLVLSQVYRYRCYVTNAAGDAWASSSRVFTTSPLGLYKMQVAFECYDKPETLTNFPLLVVLSTNISGFSYDQFSSDAGNDLMFSGGPETNLLNYEIETWNTNGSSYVWVQVPTIASSNDYIWAHWGNPSATNPPQDAVRAATWSNGYAGVWHLNDTSASDSTVHVNDGTSSATAEASGRVGGALEFDGTNSSILVNDYPKPTNTLTASAWVWADTLTPFAQNIVMQNQGSTTNGQFSLLEENDDLLGVVFQTNEGFVVAYEGSKFTSLPTLSWQHVALVADGTTLRLYRNGVERDTAVYDGTLKTAFAPLGIGAATDDFGNAYTSFWDGVIDEVRISSIGHSSNWIWACWTNQGGGDASLGYGTVEVLTVSYWLDLHMNSSGSLDKTSGWFLDGTNVPVTATPDPYYHFVGWTGDTNGCALADNVITACMDQTRHVIAGFAENLATNNTPEWWLVSHGFTNNSFDIEAMTDHDGDGAQGWKEYHAGTIPTNENSVFTMISIDAGAPPSYAVEWSSVTGKYYTIDESTNMPYGFAPIESNILATPPINSYTSPAAGDCPYFYRVRLEY